MPARTHIDRVESLEGNAPDSTRGGVLEIHGGPFSTAAAWESAVAAAIAAAEAAGRRGPFLCVPAPVDEQTWEQQAIATQQRLARGDYSGGE